MQLADPATALQRFQATCEAAGDAQRRVLQDIIALNGNADLLHLHGLGSTGGRPVAADAEALLSQLPLTTYEDYRPAVEAALEAAERGDEAGYAAAAARLLGPRPTMFCSTSGTTGVTKSIPVPMLRITAFSQAHSVLEAANALAFPDSRPGKTLQLGARSLVRTLPNGVLRGSLTACLLHLQDVMYESDPNVRSFYDVTTSPMQVWHAGGVDTAAYLHWLCALVQRHEVTSIGDFFASSLTFAITLLLEYSDCMLADLAAGAARAAWDPACTTQALPAPPGNVLAAVDARLTPNPQLAEELREVFAGGRDGLLLRLFPRLQQANCICTGSLSKYVPALQRALGEGVALISSMYVATEGSFGLAAEVMEYSIHVAAARGKLQGNGSGRDGAMEEPSPRSVLDGGMQHAQQGTAHSAATSTAGGADGLPAAAATQCFRQREHPGQAAFILHPDSQVFYEFLPLPAEGTSAGAAGPAAREQLLRMHELQVGQRYELVVTTTQGLWRYQMGDVLRCVGWFGATPKVVVEGRASAELNIASEKTPEPLLVAAVHAAAEGAVPGGAPGIPEVKDWAARECVHDAGLSAHSAGSASDGQEHYVGHYIFYLEMGEGEAPSAAACASALDAALCALGPMYQMHRVPGKLGPLEVRLVVPGAFGAVREAALREGTSPTQYKPAVVLVKPAHTAALDAAVLARGFAAAA